MSKEIIEIFESLSDVKLRELEKAFKFRKEFLLSNLLRDKEEGQIFESLGKIKEVDYLAKEVKRALVNKKEKTS